MEMTNGSGIEGMNDHYPGRFSVVRICHLKIREIPIKVRLLRQIIATALRFCRFTPQPPKIDPVRAMRGSAGADTPGLSESPSSLPELPQYPALIFSNSAIIFSFSSADTGAWNRVLSTNLSTSA